MTALRTAGCFRCEILDEKHDPHSRTCTFCRSVKRVEEKRQADLEAREARERILADLLAARWHTPFGRTIPASIAVGLTLAASEAHAAALIEPDTAGFYGIIVLCTLAAIGVMGMILVGRWRFWSPLPDAYRQPFGDVPTLPQGRGE